MIDEHEEHLYRKRPLVIAAKRMRERFMVNTPEGTLAGNAGDWLITGIKGEQYPCGDEIFRATYELVEGG